VAQEIYAKQRQRYDTAASWESNDPVLLAGEMGVESDTGRFKFGDGVLVWSELKYVRTDTIKTVTHTTASLAAGATEDVTLQCGDYFQLLACQASTPAWIRVFGTSAARVADTRTSPGGDAPAAGTEFYAEVATTAAGQVIRFSPVPFVQATNGDVFLRIVNRDSVSRAVAIELVVYGSDTVFAVIPPPPSGGSGDYFGSWVEQNYIWYAESYPPWWG
jgi:hypothetical protein